MVVVHIWFLYLLFQNLTKVYFGEPDLNTENYHGSCHTVLIKACIKNVSISTSLHDR